MTGKRIEVVKGRGGWFLRFRGANGETLAISEAYKTKWNAKRAAKKNFPSVPMAEMEG